MTVKILTQKLTRDKIATFTQIPELIKTLENLTADIQTLGAAVNGGGGGGVSSVTATEPVVAGGTATDPVISLHGLAGLGTAGQSPVVDPTGTFLLWSTPSGGGTYPKGAYWGNGTYPLSLVVMPDFIALPCQAAGVIKQVNIVTKGGVGSIECDIWKVAYASYPPLVANTICGGNYPAIVSATKMLDVTLTSWSTAVAKGDYLLFHVRSISGAFTYAEIGVEIG